jgi:hypothetical protein
MQRAAAENTGAPILRSKNPTVVSPAKAHGTQFDQVISGARPLLADPKELARLLIISIEGTDLVCHDTSTGQSEPVTFALIDSFSDVEQLGNGRAKPRIIPMRPDIVMFSDRSALRATQRLSKKNPSNSESHIDRVLKVTANLPMSQLFPTLTQALTLRYYLPSSLDTSTITDWIAAFRLGGLPVKDALTALAFQTIRASTINPDNSPDDSLLELSRSETFLAKSAAFRGTTSDVRAFRSITSITDQWEHRRQLDQTLIAENTAGSSVFAGSLAILATTGTSQQIRMDAAPKLKAGEEVIIMREDGHPVGKRKIDSIVLERDDIMVRLNRAVSSDSSGTRLVIVKTPFLSGSSTPFASPWASGKFSPTEGMVERNISAEIKPRSMPLDVLIAGQH